MLIDSHCHLNFKIFKNQVAEAIQTAKKAGVKKIIVPGTNLETSEKAVRLAQKHPEVYAAVGIHPHHTKKITNYKLQITNKLKRLAQNNGVVALGECGLDYYRYQKTKYKNYQIDPEFKNRQKEIFIWQIKLAKELALPLIIHNRLASKDLLRILVKEFNPQHANSDRPGVLHCFQGNDRLFRWALKNNFCLGFTGLVTFDRKMQAIVKKTPLKNILVETDAPFLSPRLDKIKRAFPNTPANVKIIAKRIAQIKSDSFLRIARQTSKNASRLFNL